VGLEVKEDALGQQYRTPDEVIHQSGCDVMIVGRGIYGTNPNDIDGIRLRAEIYRKKGWNAYPVMTKKDTSDHFFASDRPA